MRRAIVIGGGIIGLCAGLELARSGYAVTVIEEHGDRTAASWGNAGHIATEQVAPLASFASIRSAPRRRFSAGGALDLPLSGIRAWAPFAVRMIAASRPARFAAGSRALASILAPSLPAWKDLTELIGAADLLRRDGHFVAWESDATARSGRASWGEADTGTTQFASATPDDLNRLRRTIAPSVVDAIRFTGSGQITDLNALADALEATLIAHGDTIKRRRATIALDGDKATIDGEAPDLLIIAAGAQSGALMRAMGYRVPLIAERGYHIRARADHWPADLPPIAFEDRSMIVTRYADCVQAAGFVELNRFDAPPDPRKWDRLEAHVAALGLPIAGPFERWIGARPTLPDYLPAIGRSRHARNLIYAFGHQHLGLTLAPVTAAIVGALARDEAPAMDISPFDIGRFGANRMTS
ncbi:NAD(P)/FAD-dependent oxidoreductase [Sphingomonas alpina]|uniref:FAD-binding oxidoreductase n=1 Tax=Sphingomonas alpina TaxID=653931 RepID=A0A7H0LJ98_9SPHN|nr:FAD-binding oxidoreductase [Sphingomonas alpina]QNQ09751.1 FAD-binding oxidoreductase [Sphingomonas alpina]